MRLAMELIAVVCGVVLVITVAGLVLVEIELWRERRDEEENDK